jgi:hypothetical protein
LKNRRCSARKLFCCKISTNIQSLTGQAAQFNDLKFKKLGFKEQWQKRHISVHYVRVYQK